MTRDSNSLRVALAQMRCEKAAISENLATMATFLIQAEKRKIDIVSFPEMSLTGYADPTRYPEAVITLDGPEVGELLQLTRGDINRVYQFGAIAVLVLTIGCINFTNLTTAQSAQRAREVGLRKVSGAYRTQLMAQFLGESILMALFALILALITVKLVLPDFNAFFFKQLELNFFGDPLLALTLIGVAVFVGILAGTYLALFLSSFEPTETLKGSFRAGTRGQWIRQSLIVAQFAISIILIVGTGVIYQQLDFIKNKRLGFDMDQMVLIPIFWTDQEVKSRDEVRLADRYFREHSPKWFSSQT